MKQSHALIIAGILVAAATVAGVITLRKGPGEVSPPRPVPVGDAPVMPRPDQPGAPNEPTPSAGMISATKTYANGAYHVEGVLTLPTPCHQLLVEPLIMESYPEQVAVNFTIRDTGGMCVQVLHEQPWEFDVRVSELATFSASINGNPAIFDWGAK